MMNNQGGGMPMRMSQQQQQMDIPGYSYPHIQQLLHQLLSRGNGNVGNINQVNGMRPVNGMQTNNINNTNNMHGMFGANGMSGGQLPGQQQQVQQNWQGNAFGDVNVNGNMGNMMHAMSSHINGNAMLMTGMPRIVPTQNGNDALYGFMMGM